MFQRHTDSLTDKEILQHLVNGWAPERIINTPIAGNFWVSPASIVSGFVCCMSFALCGSPGDLAVLWRGAAGVVGLIGLFGMLLLLTAGQRRPSDQERAARRQRIARLNSILRDDAMRTVRLADANTVA